MKIISGCATDRGIVREKNQDRIVCHTTNIMRGTITAACVCDGIGSYEYGEIAAEMVTEGISLWFRSVEDGRLKSLSKAELLEDFSETIQELNELVYERRSREDRELGCTMSALLLINGRYHVFHVGDSRIYLAGDSMEQITRDEVTFSEANGIIKHRLSNCVGRQRKLWMSRLSGQASTGDAFILGSDGLFKKLDESEIYEKIRRVSSDAQARSQCEELIRKAERRGERDNISCAIIKLE